MEEERKRKQKSNDSERICWSSLLFNLSFIYFLNLNYSDASEELDSQDESIYVITGCISGGTCLWVPGFIF